MYINDITDYIGDSMVEERYNVDETEPGGIPFDAGDPMRDYQDQEIRQLNSN